MGKKKFLRWGCLILTALIYLSICSIPFVQLNPTVSEVESWNANPEAPYKIRPVLKINVPQKNGEGEIIVNAAGEKQTTPTVFLTLGETIVLGVMLVALIAFIVTCLKKRAKVGSFVREYEGEVKRITWLSWSETKKSTVLVLIALVAFAAVIALIDLGLSEGFLGFIDLFKKD